MTTPAVGGREHRPRLGRRQLADEVAVHLRDQIMAGRLRPGEFIRLEEIAAGLGVSITPVREALLTLRGEDMVELVPRRGYIVAPLSRQDVADLFRLQADIAGELAFRAASRVGEVELRELYDLQLALEDAVEAGRLEDIEHYEFEFHRVVNRAADARKLSWFLYTATRYVPARFYSGDEAWRASMRSHHNAILVALANARPGAARRAMAGHFTDGADLLARHLDKIGLWDD